MARIVFDLDGTLIDSIEDVRGVANAVLAGEGAAPLSRDEARAFIGNGAPVFVERMRAARGIGAGEQARLLADFVERYDRAVELTEPFPGVPGALERLRASGHRLGICTNKPLSPARAVLAHLGMDGFFEVVLGGDSAPRPKPDPAPLRAAFDGLGEGPCIYVGDSEVDAEAALRAGVPFLLYTEGYLKAAPETLTIRARFSDFADLPGHVDAVLDGG